MKGWHARLSHEFVDNIPERLEPGQLYVSLRHATAIHMCACGCGNEVVTPLSPADWRLTYDGESITLHPSIGNWSFACLSHYWIDRSAIRPAPRWSKELIAAGRARDLAKHAPPRRPDNADKHYPPFQSLMSWARRKLWPRREKGPNRSGRKRKP